MGVITKNSEFSYYLRLSKHLKQQIENIEDELNILSSNWFRKIIYKKHIKSLKKSLMSTKIRKKTTDEAIAKYKKDHADDIDLILTIFNSSHQ